MVWYIDNKIDGQVKWIVYYMTNFMTKIEIMSFYQNSGCGFCE